MSAMPFHGRSKKFSFHLRNLLDIMPGGELFNLVISLKFQLKSKYILLVNVLICVL